MTQADNGAGLIQEGKTPLPSATEGAVIHEHVYEKLRDALVAGLLAPGRTISVRRLAADFGVSAMPAREAIRRLVATGALELTDTRRVKIAEMTLEKLEDIRLARLALEPALAQRALARVAKRTAAKRLLVRQLEGIDNALDGAIRTGNVEDYTRNNSAFHFTLYRAANSPVLFNLVENLWMQIGPFMRIVMGRLGTGSLVDDRHKDIVGAIAADDAEALYDAVSEDIAQGMDTIDDQDVTQVSE